MCQDGLEAAKDAVKSDKYDLVIGSRRLGEREKHSFVRDAGIIFF